jgi:hypothetical protein
MAASKSAKPVSKNQATAVANFLKKKAAPMKTAAPMDAEDKLDGGVDEDKE